MLDASFTPPSAAQADALRAAGVGGFGGYLATRSGVNLARPWSRAEFDNARRCGARPIAYCSGWDDPAALRRLAADWNLRLCLDREDGIRPAGSWTQPFLDASGAGLYGPRGDHATYRAVFHVLALYLYTGEQTATWSSGVARPNGPTGWQSRGTHSEAGLTVDSGWFDDWFLTDGMPATARPRPALRGGSMGMVEVYYPPVPGRVDCFLVAPDRRVYRQFTDGGAGGVDSLSHDLAAWFGVSPETTPLGGFEPGQLSAVVDDLNRWVLTAVQRLDAVSGQAHEIVLRLDGGADQGWTAVGPPIGLTTGIVGPPGPPGVDARPAVAGALEAAVAALRAP